MRPRMRGEKVGKQFDNRSTSGLWRTGRQSKLRELIELTAVPNRVKNKSGAIIDGPTNHSPLSRRLGRDGRVSIVLGARSHKEFFMQTSGKQSPSVVLAGHAQKEGSRR